MEPFTKFYGDMSLVRLNSIEELYSIFVWASHLGASKYLRDGAAGYKAWMDGWCLIKQVVELTPSNRLSGD